jgi:hypothetical protein
MCSGTSCHRSVNIFADAGNVTDGVMAAEDSVCC